MLYKKHYLLSVIGLILIFGFVSWVFNSYGSIKNVPPLVYAENVCENNYTFIYEWGGHGSANGDFVSPSGINVDRNNFVYVADSENHRIQKFDADGLFQLAWGNQGSTDGRFSYPVGVASDPTGSYIYVVERGNHRIQKFTTDGVWQWTRGGYGLANGQFRDPRAITVAPSGDVYVSDTRNHRVQRFNSDGEWQSSWSGQNSGPYGYFVSPNGIDADFASNIYVVFPQVNVLKKFDSVGTEISSIFLSNLGIGTPKDLAVDQYGNIFIADTFSDGVWKLNPQFEVLTRFGSHGSGEGQFDNPRGIDINSKGVVFVADGNNNRVEKFRLPCGVITIKKEFVGFHQDADFKFEINLPEDGEDGDTDEYLNFVLNAIDQDGITPNEISFIVEPNVRHPELPYKVRELVELIQGYRFVDILCVDPTNDTTIDLNSASISILVSKGEEVVCTFFNHVLD